MNGINNELPRKGGLNRFLKKMITQRQLILLSIPGILLVFIFSYIPIYGITIAFQDYNPAKGFFGSEWVGLQYFEMFFKSPFAFRLLKNTFLLGLYSLLWSFPAPIILALLLDQLPYKKFKKIVQTTSYFPYFISSVVIIGMVRDLFGISGAVNGLRGMFGLEALPFLTSPEWYRTLFIGSGIWQGIGWGTIIYLAALSNVDPQLHEAATMDGANRWQRVRFITWPAIIPTTTIMLIFAVSGILGSDFQKALLLYNEATYSVADVIGTYTYRMGIQGGQYEYTTAIGLMMSVVSCALLVIANKGSQLLGESSLW